MKSRLGPVLKRRLLSSKPGDSRGDMKSIEFSFVFRFLEGVNVERGYRVATMKAKEMVLQ